jgi:hypothetical protein
MSGGVKMEKQIMWGALVFLGGWLWFYLFIRQLVFNFATAIPLLSRFRKATPDLINANAKRYLVISIIIWIIISGGTAFLVIRFAADYLWISFLIGGVLGALLYINHYGPSTKSNYLAFCGTYYRFIPDDQLRTDMYNGKISQMKVRLEEMGIDKNAVIPVFKRDK